MSENMTNNSNPDNQSWISKKLCLLYITKENDDDNISELREIEFRLKLMAVYDLENGFTNISHFKYIIRN